MDTILTGKLSEAQIAYLKSKTENFIVIRDCGDFNFCGIEKLQERVADSCVRYEARETLERATIELDRQRSRSED